MKLTITKLKAAWPEGAKVGDVVDLPEVPTWAVGKCEPAAEDATVTITFPEKAEVAAAPSNDLQERLDAATRAAADALKVADEARTALADAQAALDASKAEADDLRKQLADAQAALVKATEGKKK